MRFLILFFSFFAVQSLLAQENVMTSFDSLKTGNFYVLNGADTCFIKRTATRQFEKCQSSETEYELIVVWLKKNKYILRDIHYNPTNAPKVMRMDVVLTILEIHPTYYTVQVRTQGQKSYQMTVYRLKDIKHEN